jgi:hypothetical protein
MYIIQEGVMIMTEVKNKIVTVESLSALHEYNEDTYATKTDLGGKADDVHFHDYLPLSGGDIAGNLKINDLTFVSGANYGDTLPAAGTAGRIFFKRVQ